MTGSLPLVLSDGTNDFVYGSTDEPVEQVNVTLIASDVINALLLLTRLQIPRGWHELLRARPSTRYDVYGTLALGTPVSPFGFAGQYTDSASGGNGLVNMRARWYQAQTGEFTSMDPSLGQTNQPYSYADDDPVNIGDPTGRWTEGWCAEVSVSAFFVGGAATSCLQESNGNQQVGLTVSYGYGHSYSLNLTSWAHFVRSLTPENAWKLLGVTGSATLGYEISNSNTVTNLGGKFISRSISLGIAWGGTAEYFTGSDSQRPSDGRIRRCGSSKRHLVPVRD